MEEADPGKVKTERQAEEVFHDRPSLDFEIELESWVDSVKLGRGGVLEEVQLSYTSYAKGHRPLMP